MTETPPPDRPARDPGEPPAKWKACGHALGLPGVATLPMLSRSLHRAGLRGWLRRNRFHGRLLQAAARLCKIMLARCALLEIDIGLRPRIS